MYAYCIYHESVYRVITGRGYLETLTSLSATTANTNADDNNTKPYRNLTDGYDLQEDRRYGGNELDEY